MFFFSGFLVDILPLPLKWNHVKNEYFSLYVAKSQIQQVVK